MYISKVNKTVHIQGGIGLVKLVKGKEVAEKVVMSFPSKSRDSRFEKVADVKSKVDTKSTEKVADVKSKVDTKSTEKVAEVKSKK